MCAVDQMLSERKPNLVALHLYIYPYPDNPHYSQRLDLYIAMSNYFLELNKNNIIRCIERSRLMLADKNEFKEHVQRAKPDHFYAAAMSLKDGYRSVTVDEIEISTEEIL